MNTPNEPAKNADNSSRIRDHLANERTYLAWVRTAIALMGFGVLIVRMRYLVMPGTMVHSHGWELGLLFAVVGIVMVCLANAHYFQVKRAIDANHYEPHGRWVIVSTVAIVLIGAGILYYLFSSPDLPASITP